MKLKKLVSVVKEKKVKGNLNTEIKGVVYDPLRVKQDFLYAAINIYTQLDKIELSDGHPFVNDAIKAGASAVLLQKDMNVPDNVVKIVVPDSRLALALIAAEFYEQPSQKFKLIGITGTNGKTTTAHIIESILKQKHRTGLIGTLYYKINGKIYKSKDTTPEPPDLQEIFTNMSEQKCDYCVMEVSSHGIDFHRVAGLKYELGVWTNFTQDHLDWHKTMENYRSTKLRWFASLEPDKKVIINVDDPSAKYFIDAAHTEKITYGMKNSADVTVKNTKLSGNGTVFTLITPVGEIDIQTKLRGKFNLYNMICAAAATYAQGISLEEIKMGLEEEIIVAGRFQSVNRGQDFTVIVDYAHTPDGLVKVLDAARSMNPERIITVFGCGGDRDHSKRPKMGAIVEELSNIAIITDDNPRTEDSEKITEQIVTAFKDRCDYEVIHDRREAIQYAINIAKANDLVLIAGKGHENTQTLKDKTIHFNDFEVISEILEKKRFSTL